MELYFNAGKLKKFPTPHGSLFKGGLFGGRSLFEDSRQGHGRLNWIGNTILEVNYTMSKNDSVENLMAKHQRIDKDAIESRKSQHIISLDYFGGVGVELISKIDNRDTLMAVLSHIDIDWTEFGAWM